MAYNYLFLMGTSNITLKKKYVSSMVQKCYSKRIKHSFPCIKSMFAKPKCDNVLQPDPRSGEGCNTLLHEGFANVDTGKRMLYRHCYIPSLPTQVLTIQSQNNDSKQLAEALRCRVLMVLKPLTR